MNFFLEMILLCVLVFLFHGEPDVWDKLHAAAMNIEECKR